MVERYEISSNSYNSLVIIIKTGSLNIYLSKWVIQADTYTYKFERLSKQSTKSYVTRRDI